MKNYFLALCCIVLTCFQWVAAQDIQVYPTNWWVGMKMNHIQLLVKGADTSFHTSSISIPYSGISIQKVHQLDNGKYLAVDIAIAPNALAGKVPITIKKGQNTLQVDWLLLPRRKGNGTSYAQGVTSKDFIYLLMPDRFSNGDPSNDKIPGLRDQTLNRDSVYHRHGGDFQGIINHLDYLQQLGVTTLWMTPVLENDMPNRTEHGYAFTNHYEIEKRYGGATMYKALSDALHKRGMKLIQDAVYNHVGSYHITFLDQPCKDWYHQWPSFTQTSYKDQPVFDPYGTKADIKKTVDGWFTQEMPDLNQSNPYVANYLIQHAIWSVESFGVDGWRIDTYLYNDLPFMNRCNAALINEYPYITMFGETWVHGVPSQAYFTQNNINAAFKSNLIGVTDFQMLFDGILPTVNQPYGWSEGVNKLYTTLSYDYLYKNPFNNVVFLDNHDLNRFFSEVKGNVNKQKMGIAWLLTTRGIPQLYYGTEVLMKGEKNPNDGWVRLDFPGGWKGDTKNAFTQEGLTANEKDVLAYTTKLANFRKTSTAICNGKLMQYQPNEGLYVYFRYDKNQTVMCIMNTSETAKTIHLKNYAERTAEFSSVKDVVTNTSYADKFDVPANQMWVLELVK